jgi:hypothetical protein
MAFGGALPVPTVPVGVGTGSVGGIGVAVAVGAIGVALAVGGGVIAGQPFSAFPTAATNSSIETRRL